jgi:hypothetical protein
MKKDDAIFNVLREYIKHSKNSFEGEVMDCSELETEAAKEVQVTLKTTYKH